MSSNISFGGNTSASAGNMSVEGVSKVKQVETNTTNTSEVSNLPNIRTVKDLKLAELRGENITISDEQLIKAIDHAIKAIQGATTSLEFSVHKQTNEIMVKVKDKETGELIREIPPEKTLDFVAKLWEMAGILVDKKG